MGRVARGSMLALALSLGGGCVDGSPAIMESDSDDGPGSSSSGPVVADVTGMPPDPGTTTSTTPPTTISTSDGSSTSSVDPDSSGSTGQPGCVGDCPEHALDVVFVIDNTRGMGVAQRRLALAAQGLMAQLTALEAARGVVLDMHLMVTTTDFGNPLCTPFEPPGYSPADGSPISSACVDRLQDFTSLIGETYEQACTDPCPVAMAPTQPFIYRRGLDDNVPAGTAADALQCLLPQGYVGCGYESPLETMLQALNPAAAWNFGADPFLREGADLALVVLTNELDCSVQDYSIMEDPGLVAINPDTGMPAPSSAICWNAGVSCAGPDGMGIYTDCVPTEGLGLQPVARYTNYLHQELAINQGKQVVMLALTGVPPVVEHATRPPYEPTAGGVNDKVYREWIDGEYPVGDILPEEFMNGETAADKMFDFGIGPGCTGIDPVEGSTQALPPTRIQQVCQILDGQGGTHCCMESVCDDDYSGAMTCLRGMVETML